MGMIPGYENGFNSEEVEPSGSFEPLPAGNYEVMITGSETKATKAGNGHYLSLTFTVVNNEKYDGRLVWANLNLDNPNPKAVEIARRELSAICHAVGVLNPEDSNELHGIPMKAKIKINPATDQFPASNGINGYKSIEEGGDVPW